jgi:hypothetical protein
MIENFNLQKEAKLEDGNRMETWVWKRRIYRTKTNAVILLDMGHTLRGECAWRNREREGN